MEIARALLSDPDVLLLNGIENVFSNRRKGRLLRGLDAWRKDGGIPGVESHRFTGVGTPRKKTLFLCTNEHYEVQSIVDRVVVLGTGADGLNISVLDVEEFKEGMLSAVTSAVGNPEGISWTENPL